MPLFTFIRDLAVFIIFSKFRKTPLFDHIPVFESKGVEHLIKFCSLNCLEAMLRETLMNCLYTYLNRISHRVREKEEMFYSKNKTLPDFLQKTYEVTLLNFSFMK